jgi:DNA (cytosine-5)-methyltransferase 1
MFGYSKINPDKALPTLTTKGDSLKHYKEPRELNLKEWILGSSFPLDYNDIHKYMLGMSVPPIMTAQIATRIHEQWLSKIKSSNTVD